MTVQLQTLSLQPDATTGIDTMLDSNAPTTNYGTTSTIKIGRVSGAGYRRMLLRFDLSSIPAGSTIVTAVLTLTNAHSSVHSSDQLITIAHLGRTDWVESQATWNRCKTNTDWTAAGGDLDADGIGSTFVTTDSTSNLITSIVTLCQDAVDNASGQLDMVLFGSESAGATNYLEVYSSDESSGSVRPALAITYRLLPVVERIAQKFLARLQDVTTGNGYSQTFDAVRPVRGGAKNLVHGKAILEQAGQAELVQRLEGNPPAVEWQQVFDATICVAPDTSTDSTTPLDTTANIAAADAETAITDSDTDWAQWDGLAIDTEQTGRNISNDGELAVITLQYAVNYRTPDNDPYTAIG